MFLASAVIAVSLRFLLSAWMGEDALIAKSEVDAMWASIHRVVCEDAHAATKAGTLWGSLTLTEVNGTSYRYLVNSSHQFVRIRTGGGTAVVGVHVRQAAVSVVKNLVTLQITFTDGETREMTVCTLTGITQG